MSNHIPTLAELSEKVEQHLRAKTLANSLIPKYGSIDVYTKDGSRWWVDFDQDGNIRLGHSHSCGWEKVPLPPDSIRPIRDALNQLLGDSA
jgi:hypothetical protein